MKRPTKLATKLAAKKKTAGSPVVLALGSGAARGWAHVGVLRALRERGIPVAGIAGASMGALIGTVYAAGKLEAFVDLATGLDWRQTLYYFLEAKLPRSGLIDGYKIIRLLREHVNFPDLAALPLPLRIVATELATGREVVFERGDVMEALRASFAIPGMFTPVLHEGEWLVDGGLTNPVPVDVARGLAPGRVIAVDVNRMRWRGGRLPGFEREEPPEQKEPAGKNGRLPAPLERLMDHVRETIEDWNLPDWNSVREWVRGSDQPSVFDVIGSAVRIMEAQVSEARMKLDPPDLLIAPRLADVSFMDFHRAEEIIAEGRRATLEALDAAQCTEGSEQ